MKYTPWEHIRSVLAMPVWLPVLGLLAVSRALWRMPWTRHPLMVAAREGFRMGVTR